MDGWTEHAWAIRLVITTSTCLAGRHRLVKRSTRPDAEVTAGDGGVYKDREEDRRRGLDAGAAYYRPRSASTMNLLQAVST